MFSVRRIAAAAHTGRRRTMRLLSGFVLLPLLSLSATAQGWTSKTPPPDPIGSGASAATAGGLVYLLRGANTNQFLAYDPSTDTWSPRAALPDVAIAGAGLVATGAFLYAVQGGGAAGFYRYDIAANSWTPVKAA